MNPYSDIRLTIQAALGLEAGRTLRWKSQDEREQILEYLVTHWDWVERTLEPFWRPLQELYSDDAGMWDRHKASTSRELLKDFDLRLTVLIQQTWLRILMDR